MIEVTGLGLESISSKVKQDSSKELKVIQDIKLYDKTGKIVFTYGDGKYKYYNRNNFQRRQCVAKCITKDKRKHVTL